MNALIGDIGNTTIKICLVKTEDFKILTKEDTRKHNRKPKNLSL